MKVSFSTLACPDWTMPQIIDIASAAKYDGIELRFVENEDSLWKLAAFRGEQLAATRQSLADRGLAISCVDTSCRFDSPDRQERARWIEEGRRMSELAAALGAPGIRVFGEKIHADADRASTRTWIADSIRQLADRNASNGIEVWLETHGDFASASETVGVLREVGSAHVGSVWDPANCFLECKERPQAGAGCLGSLIRHVHLKDLALTPEGWKPVITGDGVFPLLEVRSAFRQVRYDRYVSFEWEKKWHPHIADASVVLPHFSLWFRENF
jgi:sugar phosphate isomerase/epimerase